MQIPSDPSNLKISDLYGMIRRGELILQPEFQRKLVWSKSHKEAFIDTILKGYPFPEIYIAQKGIDLDTLQAKEVVVDGQQRLSTIMNYIEGDDFCKTIKHFSELDEDEKKDFMKYSVVTRDLKDADTSVLKEVFRRINLTKYSLEPIEIDNAVFDGEFINTGKEILQNIDVDDFDIFSEREVSRMGDLGYIMLLMATIETGGYFAGNSQVEELIIKYNDEYPNAQMIKDKFLSVFTTIHDIGLSRLSIWYRKSNFYTLFIELCQASYIPEDIFTKLNQFENKVLEAKEDIGSDFGKYYAAMYTGTNSRTARVIRGDLFKKYILS